jgi:hypothetical protein
MQTQFVVKKVPKPRKNGGAKMTGECSCRESEHTGFPCPHLCLLNYKGLIDQLEINPRWYKSNYGGGSRPNDPKLEIISVKHESMKPSALESNKPSATESDLIRVR